MGDESVIAGVPVEEIEVLEAEWSEHHDLSLERILKDYEVEAITQDVIDTFFGQVDEGSRCNVCGRHETAVEQLSGGWCSDCFIDRD